MNPVSGFPTVVPGSHIVQVHYEAADLIDAVGDYALQGQQLHEAVVLVGTRHHLDAVGAWLVARSASPAHAKDSGELIMLDAEETLASFMVAGAPDWDRFRERLGGVIRQAHGTGARTVRVWGEMVNLLWQRRQVAMALQLEELWNRLNQELSFRLFCTYLMEPFSDTPEERAMLEGVARTHAAILPMERYRYIETAVDSALDEILGPSQSGMVRTLIRTNPRLPTMPRAQATMLWLQENMPLVAGRILERAKSVYTRVCGDPPQKSG